MSVFRFKQFQILQDRCAMKVGTDGVLLGAWVDPAAADRILDIGTGSGLIALMLAQKTKTAGIWGVEIDGAAAGQAAENARDSPWGDRIKIVSGPVQAFTGPDAGFFDLIVSNPPFFERALLSADQARNRVRHALDLTYSDLIATTDRLLAERGRFCVILPADSTDRFNRTARSCGLFCTRQVNIFTRQGKPASRRILQFERKEKEISVEELTIQDNTADRWTKAYRALTSPFYLHME